MGCDGRGRMRRESLGSDAIALTSVLSHSLPVAGEEGRSGRVRCEGRGMGRADRLGVGWGVETGSGNGAAREGLG